MFDGTTYQCIRFFTDSSFTKLTKKEQAKNILGFLIASAILCIVAMIIPYLLYKGSIDALKIKNEIDSDCLTKNLHWTKSKSYSVNHRFSDIEEAKKKFFISLILMASHIAISIIVIIPLSIIICKSETPDEGGAKLNEKTTE